MVSAASAALTSPVLTVVPTVRPSHVVLPALTVHRKVAALTVARTVVSTVRPAPMRVLTSVATVQPGHRNSAHRVAVLKAVLTAPTVRLLTVVTGLRSPVKTVVHLPSAGMTVVVKRPVGVSVVSTVAQQVTVVLTATVVHRTVPSTGLTNVLKAVASNHAATSKHAALRPSVQASRLHAAVHPHVELSTR